MKSAIQNADWDFITLQQASGSSGMPDTYEPYLSNLIEYVNTYKTNPDAKILWHMTWAYQQDSTHSAFPNYNKDQLTMYNAIVDTMKAKVHPHKEIAFCIPTGTVIQNARTTYYGDNLTRDGYHLGKQQGRYIAGLTWYHTISGMPLENVSYAPNTTLLWKSQQMAMKESIYNGVLHPEKVTPSQYPDQTYCFDLENDFTELEWDYTKQAYWYSTNSTGLYTGTSGTPLKFIATKKFTKDEIPVGSVIVLDKGYMYRPEGWQTADAVNENTRADNSTSRVVEVTEVWWSNYTLRAFNITTNPSASIVGKEEEVASHFRIYVPKNK